MNIQKFSLAVVQNFISEELTKQKEHLILWWPIFVGLGVSFYFSLQSEPSYILWVFMSVALGGFALFLKSRLSWMFVPLFIVALFSLGVGAGALRTESVYTPHIEKKYRIVRVVGTVQSVEEREKGAKRLRLFDLDIEHIKKDQTPKFIQLTMRQKKEVVAGQRISILASLRPPSPPILPHGFDFQRHFYFKSIGATGFTLSNPEVIEESIDVHGNGLGQFFFNVSEAMKSEVREVDSRGNPIVQALLTGDRALIDEKTWAHLRNSGLSHMLAISGLHVGLFSATVFFIVRLCLSFFPSLSLRFSIKKYAAVIAFLSALFYTLLVGASVPTIRACVMTGMFFLAIILDRSPFSVHLLAFAAFVVLLIRPESLMSASFQMSFAAVMGLIVFYSTTRKFWVEQYSHSGIFRKLGLYFVSVCATTVIATIVTTPFTLYHFQHIAVYGVLGNLLAVPIMAFVVMPMAVFSFFLLPFGLAYWPLMVMRFGVERIMDVSSWVGSMDGASVSMATLPFAGFCLFVISGLYFITVKGRLKVFALVPLSLALVVMISTRPADVMISEDGKLAGIYKDHQLYVTEARKGRFTQKQWKAHVGLHCGDKAKGLLASGCVDGICCDDDACHTEISGVRLSFLKNKYAIRESCENADVVIAPFHVSRKICASPSILDWDNYKREGGHLLWMDNGVLKVQTVESNRGRRPWNSVLD